VVEQSHQLGDGVDEDQVEEQLDEGDPLVLVRRDGSCSHHRLLSGAAAWLIG
jgi:hypothetical protein